MNGPGHAISLRGVTYAYGPRAPEVLHDVAVDIPAGSITAILGPNGSGKTTLLRLLLGALRPWSGTIRLAGRPQEQYSRRDLSRLVGLVPQEELVPFDLSVLEFVLLGRAPYLGLLEQPGERDREIARRALEAAGVAALSHRAVPSLSGGERQLVTIARALVQESVILLSDEPTAHLDPANTRRVLDVLRSLERVGRTIVFTTHDPNLAAAIADHAVLLREGRILAAAPIGEVLRSAPLSATYGIDVEVVDVRGRPFVVTQ